MLLLFLAVVLAAEGTSCPNTTAVTKGTKPLYLLTLLPFPDLGDNAGWDRGLGTVPAARVARDEINNRTDLLPGYHIELIVEDIEACSRNEAGIGLNNLVKYTVNPPCRPVVAVTGLMCSTHTARISPVAGHEGIDLVQLSVANAPIFNVQNLSLFPHLWRVLGSGTVYADAMLSLMNTLGWNKVGILYETTSYFTHVTNRFEKLLSNQPEKKVRFSIGIHKLNSNLIKQIVSNIREQFGTVLFVALNDQMEAQLLCKLQEERLIFPSYIWVHVGKRLARTIETNTVCSTTDLLAAAMGHIQLEIRAIPLIESVLLVSNETYHDYRIKYNESLQEVRKEYTTKNVTYENIYANLLYDQVWALSLALNNSLPVLESKNLSIDNYVIGQREITDVIENHLAKVDFQGASGRIKFTDNHGVQPTVDIYRINGSREVLVGSYVPYRTSENDLIYNLSLTINSSDVPGGEPRKVFIFIPLPVAAMIYTAAGLTILFTTVVLLLLIYFREWPEVKATSPLLSSLMFIGVYLLSVGILFRTSYGSFRFSEEDSTYGRLTSIAKFCDSLGLTLLVVTIFFKLLRVHHFFSNMTLKLKHMWKSCSLLFLVMSLSLFINIVHIVIDNVHPVQPMYHIQEIVIDNVLVIIKRLKFPADLREVGYIGSGVVLAYNYFFLIWILYLAFRTRKIEQKQFKDTKKIYIFVVVLVVTQVLEYLISIPLSLSLYFWQANFVVSLSNWILAMSVLVILFLPKLLPSMFKPKPVRRRSTRRSSSRRKILPNLSVNSFHVK